MAGLKGNLRHISTERRDMWTRIAGEDIGKNPATPDRYPLVPINAQGIPVYISETADRKAINIEVKIMTVSDASTVTQYDGITYNAAVSGDRVVVHCAGEIWMTCGFDAIVAGDEVMWEINSGENSNAAVVGDVMPLDEASDGYGTDFAGMMLRHSAFVGKALTNADGRTSATVFDYVLVRLKGF